MNSSSKPVEYCPATVVKSFSYNWEIRKFKRSSKIKGFCFTSPIFKTTKDPLGWMLKLYPRGITSENSTKKFGDKSVVESKDIAIYLELAENTAARDLPVVRAKFHVSVMRGSSCHRRSGFDEFLEFGLGKSCRVLWRRELFDQEGHLSKGGKLKLRCDISVQLDDSILNPEPEPVTQLESTQSLHSAEVLSQMLDDELYADVLLSVRGHEFPAHRSVLCAQSPVFRAMFEPTKNRVQNRVVVTDTSPEALQAILQFVYTDKVPENLPEFADELLLAAHKYGLYRLKDLCETVVRHYIDIDSAVYILTLAEQSECSLLKQQAVRYICLHSDAVMRSDRWADLKQHPELLLELCRKLASKEKRKSARFN